MKTIRPSKNNWPRHAVKSVDCRKRDLVVRITDWMKDRDEPGFDVEVYVGGVYDWNESRSFTVHDLKTGQRCREAALAFVAEQTAKLL